MKFTDWKPPKPVNVIPTTPARDDNAPVVIVGKVRDVKGTQFRLWDDPVANWFRAPSENYAMMLADALADNVTVRVTVEGKEVKGIQI